MEQPDRMRRRIDEVFGDGVLGDLLPSTTADERDDGTDRGDPSRDDELLANRPPHHDDRDERG